MKTKNRLHTFKYPLIAILVSYGTVAGAFGGGNVLQCKLLTAARLFDGLHFPQENMGVLVEGNKVKQVAPYAQLKNKCLIKINLGDATILPGFIESHAHIAFQNVRKDKVLEHGITTAQDTGGPLKAPEGGQGSLRLLSTGPIIQAEGGYPLNIFTPHDSVGGYDKVGIAVSSVAEAEEVVQHIADGGANAIKIALEPGGETGAPWMMPHGEHAIPKTPWSILPDELIQAIVAKAHALNKPVIAHVGEQTGFDRALAAGVDEFAHMPCADISESSLHAAVAAGVTFVTTIDTLGSCAGIHGNAHKLGHIFEHQPNIQPNIIYGSEIAHENVPWGINGEEMRLMLHLLSGQSIDFNDVVNVFRSATSVAGENLGIPGLGTLSPGAPADIIAVKGNPFEKFKLLEYPDLVMSGGKIVVFKFSR